MTAQIARSVDELQRLKDKRQRARSLAIAVSLAVLVSLFYAATIVRMGGHVQSGAGPNATAPGSAAPANPGSVPK